MIRRYLSLLATPGALGFVLPGFVARLPSAMRPLGCVLLVSALTGSYGLAGATSAALTVAQAAVGPRLGRLADRRGQRPVLLAAVAAHTAGICALTLSAQLRAPPWTLLGTAALVGASVPPVGAMVRSRWAALSAGRDQPSTFLTCAYALETVLNEAIFVVGPVVVSALALTLFPAAGLLGGLVLLATGATVLASRTRTDPGVLPPDPSGQVSAIRVPGIRVTVLSFVGCGIVFGSVEVALVAFAAEQGNPGAAWVLVALFALGSLAAALAYGARDWRSPPERRALVSLAWLFLGTGPMLLSGTILPMAVAVTVAGIAIAPSMVAASTLIERLAPRSALTEAFAWLSNGVVIGVAVGASAAGQVIDGYGARPAFLVASAGGLVAVLTVAAGWRHLRTAPAPAIPTTQAPETRPGAHA